MLLLLLSLLAPLAVRAAQSERQRIDLNTASVEELKKLPDIGPARAKAIIDFREKSGPFRRVEELLAVPGISKRRLEKIRPFVYVTERKTQKPETAPSEPPRS